MLTRLGYVLCWAGYAAAVAMVLMAAIALSVGAGASAAALMLVTALGAWIAGRACRYVLAGA